MSKYLTNKHLDEFKEKGFFIIRNFFKTKKLKNIKKEIYFLAKKEKFNRNHIYYENQKKSKIIRRIERITEDSKSVYKLLNEKRLMLIIRSLMKDKFILFKDKLNLKLPGGEGFEPHIDGHFTWIDKKKKIRKGWQEYSNNFLNVVIPLEKTNKDNGCLRLADLHSTKKYLGNSWKKINSKLDYLTPKVKKKYIKSFKFQSIEQNPGDVLFFDWRVCHSSKKNNSKKSRMIFYVTYAQLKEGKRKIRQKYYSDKVLSKNPLFMKSIN